MNKDEIISILKISKYKKIFSNILKLLELAESKNAFIYTNGTCLLCVLRVEDFEMNKQDFNYLNYFTNFKYDLNQNEFIVPFFVSSNPIDTKIVSHKFIDELNPKTIHFYNNKHHKIRVWERKYMNLFRDLND